MCRLLTWKVIIIIILKLQASASKYGIDEDFNSNQLWPKNNKNILVLSINKNGNARKATKLEIDDLNKALKPNDINVKNMNFDDFVPDDFNFNKKQQKDIQILREHWSHIPEDFEKRVKAEERLIKQQKREEKKIQAEHEARLAFITEFLATHHTTAKYVQQEVTRIRKTGLIKDELRKMVRIIEKPKFEHVKNRVIECFDIYKSKMKESVQLDNYGVNPNTLVQHVIQDPLNDGVIG